MEARAESVEPTPRTARTDVLEVAYEERGPADGVPVVLAHGFPDDARTWDAVVEPLVARGCRTIVPYLRGFGPTRFLHVATPRSGQLAALAVDLADLLVALDLRSVVLVGHDWGARAAYGAAVLAAHRLRALVALSVGYATNIPSQQMGLDQARAYWYQWFFGTPRGAATFRADPLGFCRYLWSTWSPGWRFDDAEFARTARSFANPDFVAIAIHSYRHRWGDAPSDPRYDGVQESLDAAPPIALPTIVLHGVDDGATLPVSSAGRERFFTRGYERRMLDGVGHFVQRERPQAVVDAILAQLAATSA